MRKNVVIDTNIWIGAVVDDDDYNVDCEDVVVEFMNHSEYCLAVDVEGIIEQEYRDNLANNRRFQTRMKQLDREKRKCYVSGKVLQKHKKELKERGFHEEEDHVFVGTSMNTDHIIITEDSDYGVHGEKDKVEVYRYMRDKMTLRVYRAIEARSAIQGSGL